MISDFLFLLVLVSVEMSLVTALSSKSLLLAGFHTDSLKSCTFLSLFSSVDKLWQSLGLAEDDYRQLCTATGQRGKKCAAV